MAKSPKGNTTKKSVSSSAGSKKSSAPSVTNKEADWGYENDPTSPVWMYASFTKGGSYTLAQTMITKFGCTILEKPFMRDDGVWVFMFTNPFMKEVSDEV